LNHGPDYAPHAGRAVHDNDISRHNSLLGKLGVRRKNDAIGRRAPHPFSALPAIRHGFDLVAQSALLPQASSDKSLVCMTHCHIRNYILKSIRITENISTPHIDFHDNN
jgi:hypothetical protein